MNLRIEGVYGGTNINTQKQLVYNGLDILVATPGRLIDLTFGSFTRYTPSYSVLLAISLKASIEEAKP